MSKYTLRYTPQFTEDLDRIFDYLTDRDQDLTFAEKALEEIAKHLDQLANFPFNYRKVYTNNPYFREIIIPLGKTGYVARFEIEGNSIVTILAIRHQRETDYH